MPAEIANHSIEIRYKAAGEYCKFLYDRGLIINVVAGWQYITTKYGNSVFKIVNIDKDDNHSIGTGFYYAAGDEKFTTCFIVTNKHVIENAKVLKVYFNNNAEIFYDTIIEDSHRDLAYIMLNGPLFVPPIHIYPGPDVLSEIITIGFPSIPMTKEAYQVFHKGEVNSFVEDYQSNKFFLFSAKTSSGNSGSPIINNYGMSVGIVAQDFFEQNQFFSKGKPSYYAGIPGTEIINSMNEFIFSSKNTN